MNDHPLFPPMNDSEDSPEVTQIHVTRIEAGRPVYCPHLFGADELLSLEQVADMFGGGDYELVARDGKTFSARRRYTLPGKSRPLLIGNNVETNQETQVNVQLPPPQSDMMAFLQLMAQKDSANMQLMMQMSQQSMQGLVAIITAAFGNNKGTETGAIIQAMQSNSNTAMNSQTELFKAALASKGGDGVAAAREILELAKLMKESNGAGGGNKDDDDAIGETIGQVVEALNMAGRLTGETEGVPIPDEVQVQ
jgi:hypothetical protein